MPTHKSNDYKLTAVQYYLVEDKTQEVLRNKTKKNTKKYFLVFYNIYCFFSISICSCNLYLFL
jgi:hypothetical protein